MSSTLSKYYSGHVRPGKSVLQSLIFYMLVVHIKIKNTKYHSV